MHHHHCNRQCYLKRSKWGNIVNSVLCTRMRSVWMCWCALVIGSTTSSNRNIINTQYNLNVVAKWREKKEVFFSFILDPYKFIFCYCCCKFPTEKWSEIIEVFICIGKKRQRFARRGYTFWWTFLFSSVKWITQTLIGQQNRQTSNKLSGIKESNIAEI